MSNFGDPGHFIAKLWTPCLLNLTKVRIFRFAASHFSIQQIMHIFPDSTAIIEWLMNELSQHYKLHKNPQSVYMCCLQTEVTIQVLFHFFFYKLLFVFWGWQQLQRHFNMLFNVLFHDLSTYRICTSYLYALSVPSRNVNVVELIKLHNIFCIAPNTSTKKW